MKLTQLGSNQTQIENREGNLILYSYNTPVAVKMAGTGEYLRTSKQFSKTTSAHINKWVGAKAREVEQSYIERLA
jgi:hypothetical protein